MIVLKVILTLFVIIGSVPLFTSLYQFSMVGWHGWKNHYKKAKPFYPRVAIIVPAWNEGNVIGNTIERLYDLEYPKDSIRVYVVDDASTDHTPDVVKEKHKKYPNNVFHLRREKGGEGKAHTLNHGIAIILEENWAEAMLIIDADVLFEKKALSKMARHLVDPEIGSVTAYIKEGSAPGNYITKCIAFEYITAQAASRRAQNVMGVMACLAGGAQLHSRENMIAIGGKIDTSSLAEDTFTTFKTQLNGRKAIFDPNALVWAEEPDGPVGVWKQRLRWARGNVQLTRAFKHVWFNKGIHKKLGSIKFGIVWFSIILMPNFMIIASLGLTGLFFVDFPLSWYLFNQFWILNSITYLFVTLFSFLIDPVIAKRSWLQGILFPGVISLTIILISLVPGLMDKIINYLDGLPTTISISNIVILFMYTWLAVCMIPAWLSYKLDLKKAPAWQTTGLIVIAGFGPLLCAITWQSYISELNNEELKWDKTEKTGKVTLGG